MSTSRPKSENFHPTHNTRKAAACFKLHEGTHTPAAVFYLTFAMRQYCKFRQR